MRRISPLVRSSLNALSWRLGRSSGAPHQRNLKWREAPAKRQSLEQALGRTAVRRLTSDRNLNGRNAKDRGDPTRPCSFASKGLGFAVLKNRHWIQPEGVR